MTDYSEEQRNEVEALQSIYPDSFTGERRPPRLSPGRTRGRPPAGCGARGALPAPSVRASGPGVGAGESLGGLLRARHQPCPASLREGGCRQRSSMEFT